MEKDQEVFTASFVKNGRKCGRDDGIKKTLLFQDIKYSDGTLFSDHSWFNYSEVFSLALKKRDIISFNATPEKYIKGYQGNKQKYKETESGVGYKLVLVNNVKIIK